MPKAQSLQSPTAESEIRQNRLALADALDSGRYAQQHGSQRLYGVLRDDQDRYSITGVATRELTNSLWVRTRRTWDVYDRPDVAGIVPADTAEETQPSEEVLALLRQSGATPVCCGCPPQTAHAVGVPQTRRGHIRHPDVLWFRTYLLTPNEMGAAGIPENWHLPYCLDALDFPLAAHLLRQHPDLLGANYKREEHRG